LALGLRNVATLLSRSESRASYKQVMTS